MCVFPARIFLYHMSTWYFQLSGHQMPWSLVLDGCRDSNLVPLGKQQMFLIAELSLHFSVGILTRALSLTAF